MIKHIGYNSPLNNAVTSTMSVDDHAVVVKVAAAVYPKGSANVYVRSDVPNVRFTITHVGPFIQLDRDNATVFKMPLFTRINEVHSIVRTHVQPEWRAVILHAFAEHRAMVTRCIGV